VGVSARPSDLDLWLRCRSRMVHQECPGRRAAGQGDRGARRFTTPKPCSYRATTR